MIKDDPEALFNEVKGAEEFRDTHLKAYRAMLKQTAGPSFREWTETGKVKACPENSYYEFVSLTLPRMVMDNPRVRVTSRWAGLMEPEQDGQLSEADSLRHTLNRWARDGSLDDKLRRFATDGYYAFGSGITRQRPLKGRMPSAKDLGLEDGRSPMAPEFTRLLPHRVFWDPIADEDAEKRFIGHEYYQDKEQLKALAESEEGWDLAAINKIETIDKDRERGEESPRVTGRVARGEVQLREVWVPEHGKVEDREEGFHGMLYTLAYIGTGSSKQAVFVRDPRPMYGPRTGQYSFWGGYQIGDDPFWLSPLVALQPNIDHHNKMARAVQLANVKRKHGVAVSDSDPALQDRIKRFMDHGILSVNTEDLNKHLKEITVGGATPEDYEALDRARENYERISGISDARRGSLAGAGSATEVAIADGAATVRFDYLNKQFQAGVTDVLRTAAWYFYEDPRSRYPLGPEAAEAMGVNVHEGPKNLWYRRKEDEIPFEAYEFDIEMHSMQRVDEGLRQKRVIEYASMVMQAAQAAVTLGPEVCDWNEMVKMVGESLNLPDAVVKLNLEAVGQAHQEQMQAQAGPPDQGPAPVANPAGNPSMGQMMGADAGAAMGAF